MVLKKENTSVIKELMPLLTKYTKYIGIEL